MMVGGGVVFDQDGVDDPPRVPAAGHRRVRGEPRGTGARTSSSSRSRTPSRRCRAVTYSGWRRSSPRGPRTTASSRVTSPPPRSSANRTRRSAESLGWKNVYNDVYPSLGAERAGPRTPKALKSDGVKGLIWVGEPRVPRQAAPGDAATSTTRRSSSAPTPTTTTQKLIDRRWGARSRTTSTSAASSSRSRRPRPGTATEQYLDAFDEYLPDGKNRTYLGLQAFSAWLLFAKAAKECGDDLTRKCVYDNAKKVTDVDRWRAPRQAEPRRRERRRLLHPRAGDTGRLRARRHQAERRRSTTATRTDLVHARGRLRQGRHARGRRKEHVRLEVADSSSSGVGAGGMRLPAFPHRAATGPTGRPWTSS